MAQLKPARFLTRPEAASNDRRPAGDQAATKINELKSSLRDLGLDENIEL